MRGRKPVPYKLKLLTQSAPGFDRGGHAIKIPPPFAKGGVQKPTDLSPDADEFWDKVVPELERLELVGEANFAGLIAMAECYARMMQATRIIRTQGVMGHDPDKGQASCYRSSRGVLEKPARIYGLVRNPACRRSAPRSQEGKRVSRTKSICL